jgi:excisionase family DNA binding protein
MDRLLTADEVAEALQLTRRQLNRLARDGSIPSIALPDGQLRFDDEALRYWVQSLKRGYKIGDEG